jgi:predicted deacylase
MMALDDTPYPVEIEAPDISAYRNGNTGVQYVTSFDGGAPGPHVMVNAVTHGNELCGVHALDFLFRHDVRPRHGRLTLSFANVAAYTRFDPESPSASRFVDEDFNRVWDPETLESRRDSVELRRARDMRPIVDDVDFLLDIHSMQHFNLPLMMCGPTAKGRRLARALGAPAHVVSDHGHAAGRRLRDYGGFGNPRSRRNALLVECGQHWQRRSVEVAIEITLRFLEHFDVVDKALVDRHVPAAPLPPQRVIEVTEAITVENDSFAFTGPYVGQEVIRDAGTVIAHDGDRPIRTRYDNCVLIMPSRRLWPGQTAVRLGRFVP